MTQEERPEEREAPPTPPGFRLDARVGEGAFGAVYRGTELATGKTVAIKFILRGGDIARRRFLREGQVLSQLRHPCIVSVSRVDAVQGEGEPEGGTPFIVLEWIEGVSLLERLPRPPPLTGEEVLDLMRMLFDGLGAAHEAGFVHRDIKPANVLLPHAGGLKIADFGLARGDATLGGLTRKGEMLGTPTYMAPEQAMGLGVDYRADLYAAGIVFYELLAGRPPFVHAHKSALIEAHISEPPPPLGELVPGLPPRVIAIVDRLLEKHPSKRPPSARDAAAALAALEAGERHFVPSRAPAAGDEDPTLDNRQTLGDKPR